jgi:hypothetical protein
LSVNENLVSEGREMSGRVKGIEGGGSGSPHTRLQAPYQPTLILQRYCQKGALVPFALGSVPDIVKSD